MSFLALAVVLLITFPTPDETELRAHAENRPPSKGKLSALWSFTSPVSLFPPSAIISLTDDNSTFFLARPAAFGPPLPEKGLSGPLWVGGGFGDDETAHGELGCSDVPEHADIQTLQEGAEISGKIVLLKRGGCGFLDKAKWAQRRGGTAVIVGDNIRGEALIRMYAQGDTSNLTIPAVFTSFTTAQLLSSLVPSKSGHPKHLAHANFQTGPVPTSQEGEPTISKDRTTDGYTVTGEKVAVPITDPRIEQQADPSEDSGRFSSLMRFIGLEDLLRPRLSASSSATSRPDIPRGSQAKKRRRWLFGWLDDEIDLSTIPLSGFELKDPPYDAGKGHRDGLWVTLSPTNMSSNPFFDTLLVLVVSPLVTLTVVYALLLIRSRIRRRRWRAPKSVVDRLPVRTYHTISDTNSTPSATPAATNPTTPLLQHSQSCGSSPTSRRSCRQSGTAPDGPAGLSSFQGSSPTSEEEKRDAGLAEWRRRYGGRQKECVVCLEEYVDGVSQVMSLPCGHEFHAECITPWLVTRRRTCPICKGDVVRDLSRSHHDRRRHPDSRPRSRSPSQPQSQSNSSTSARHRFPTPSHQNSDDIQNLAATTRNDAPESSRPITTSTSYARPLHDRNRDRFDDDVEANAVGTASSGGAGSWVDIDNPLDDASSTSDSDGERGRSDFHQDFIDVNAGVRDLSQSVRTVIWRGFDAVRDAVGMGGSRRGSRVAVGSVEEANEEGRDR